MDARDKDDEPEKVYCRPRVQSSSAYRLQLPFAWKEERTDATVRYVVAKQNLAYNLSLLLLHEVRSPAYARNEERVFCMKRDAVAEILSKSTEEPRVKVPGEAARPWTSRKLQALVYYQHVSASDNRPPCHYNNDFIASDTTAQWTD